MSKEIFIEDILTFCEDLITECDLGDGCPEKEIIEAIIAVFGDDAEEAGEWVLSHSPFQRERIRTLKKGEWEWMVRLKLMPPPPCRPSGSNIHISGWDSGG